jgi:predicted nucleic acid-binding protein
MNADVFLDTNVLLYAIDENPASASKRQRANDLIQSERWGWSLQVAAEFFVNATSARRPFRLATDDAAALVETWLSVPTLDLTPALYRAAVALHQRYGISYWDAAIIAAAKEMGCSTVYSEDLSDGQAYDGVTIVNPFKALTT